MALSAGAVVAQFDGDFSGLNKGLQQAQNKVEGFTGGLNNAGKRITGIFAGIGGAALRASSLISGVVTTGFVAFAVKTSGELQSLSSSFETLTGSAEKGRKVFMDLKKMGATTPFETRDLAKATQTMLSFGISIEDSQKNLKMLGDISLGNKEKLQGLTLAFSQVQSTGRLMGQDLLQMINQGFNPLQIISEKTGKSMKTLKKEMEEGKITTEMVADAFKTATSEGGLFYKGMDKGAQTLNGTFSTLMDNISNMAAGLVGLAEDGTIVEGSLLSLVQKGVNYLNERLGAINWAKVGQDINNNIVTAINNLRTTIENLISWYNQHKIAIEVVMVTLGSFVISLSIVRGALLAYNTMIAISTALTGGFAAVLAFITSPIGWIVIAIAALIAIGYTLWRNWSSLTAEGTFLGNKIQWVKDRFNQLKDSVFGLIQALGNIRMPKALTDIMDKMKGLSNVPGLGNFFKGKIPGFANGVRNFSGGLAVVGERGPELVNLPKGADVFTNEESRRMTSGGGGITIENMNIKSGVDWELGASYMAQKLRLS
jgi:tape measure domain-containing protein